MQAPTRLTFTKTQVITPSDLLTPDSPIVILFTDDADPQTDDEFFPTFYVDGVEVKV